MASDLRLQSGLYYSDRKNAFGHDQQREQLPGLLWPGNLVAHVPEENIRIVGVLEAPTCREQQVAVCVEVVDRPNVEPSAVNATNGEAKGLDKCMRVIAVAEFDGREATH